MKGRLIYLFLLISLMAVAAVAQSQTPYWAAAAQEAVSNVKVSDRQAALEAFRRGGGKGLFIVHLKEPVGAAAVDKPLRQEEQKHQRRAEVNAMREQFLARMPAFARKVIRNRYDNLFAFSVEVTPDELRLLSDSPDVAYLEPNYMLHPALAQGIPLIRADTHRSSYNGQGLSIAVVDTGIDYNNPYLGGGGFPNSKIIGGYDIGQRDSDPLDLQGHGTRCAGIAAGALAVSGDYIGGVAYNAKLYALKVTNTASGDSANLTDVVDAWDWCVTHQNANPVYPILIITTSMASGKYGTNCDNTNDYTTALAKAAANAKAAGITLFVSSGNDGFCDALSSPACISHVISVGEVYDAGIDTYFPCISLESCAQSKVISSECASGAYAIDNPVSDMVASSSNSGTFLNLLAPGYKAYTLDIKPLTFNTSFGGTSAASPYAAGAAAALQSAARAKTGSWLTPDQVKYYLTSTGNSIIDPKNGITKPRVNLEEAIKALPSTQILNLVPIISELLLSDQASPPPSDQIQNGTFELGHIAWTEYTQQPGYEIIKTTFPGTVTPHSGSYAAWLGGVYSNTNYIRQSVTVPPNLPYLTYYQWIASADICGFDHAYVRINETNLATLQLCSSNSTDGWAQASINLSTYAGQTVSLEFRCTTDSSLNSNWFIDDVSFQTYALDLSDKSTFKISNEIVSSDSAMPQKNTQP